MFCVLVADVYSVCENSSCCTTYMHFFVCILYFNKNCSVLCTSGVGDILCTPVYLRTLSKCSPTVKWINKLWFIHIMLYSVNIQWNTV